MFNQGQVNSAQNSINQSNSSINPQRVSMMTVNTDSRQVLNRLKEQCFERIKSKRKSMLDERRKKSLMLLQTQSKAKRARDQVNRDMAEDAEMLGQIIQKEILNIHSLDDPEVLIKEHDNIMKEVNEFLIEQLLDQSQWDEGTIYELEERQSIRDQD